MSTAHREKPPAAAAGASKFNFGSGSTGPATESAAATTTAPGEAGEAPAPRAAREEKQPAATAPALRRPRPASGFDYAAGTAETRVKDPGGVISPSLASELKQAQLQWSAENWARLDSQGLSAPTTSGFREALLRVGLKYIDDPEFIDLIPPDGRRRGRG